MTTNKPEVVAYTTHHDEPMLLPTLKEAAAYCDDGEEPIALIRLSDYERLQADHQGLQAECEKLVQALEEVALWTERWTAPGHPISTIARKALAAHRQGGDV